MIFKINFQRGKEGGREGEKHQRVRETSIRFPLQGPSGDLAYNPGMCPAWGIGDLLVCGKTPNPESHTNQGILPVSSHRFYTISQYFYPPPLTHTFSVVSVSLWTCSWRNRQGRKCLNAFLKKSVVSLEK